MKMGECIAQAFAALMVAVGFVVALSAAGIALAVAACIRMWPVFVVLACARVMGWI